MNRILRLFDFFIHSSLRSDADLHLKARLMIQSLMLVLPLMLFYAVEYAMLGHYWGTGYSVFGLVCATYGLIDMRRRGNLRFTAHFFTFVAYTIIWAFTITTNGLASMVAPWVIMVPITTFLVLDLKSGLFWSFASLIQVATLFVLDLLEVDLPSVVNEDSMAIVNLCSLLGLVGYIIIVFLHNDRGKSLLLRDLRKAKGEVDQKNHQITNINQELEQTVAKRTERLQAANDELDTFLYESSHALRRPLVRIQGLLSLVDQATDPLERKQYMDLVGYTAQGMDKVLHDLILVSEIYHRELTLQPVGLRQEVEKVWTSLLVQNAELLLDIPANFTLTTNPELLRIVLVKLLDNAQGYRQEGRTHRVRVTLGASDLAPQLCIEDNGAGVDPKALPQLFKMFSRGTERSRGHGLGLFIVNKVMDRLGGKVDLHSEKGKGTVVRLDFPTATAHN